MEHSGGILLSIIIPVYNTAPYLEACIESVAGQTWNNLEIILVNDGSTDNSLSICRKYQQEDQRIRVVDQPNGGVVSAKKAGFRLSEGAFIGWVDSDDWVEADYFQRLMDEAAKSGADIVAGNIFHDIDTSHSQCDRNGIAPGIYDTCGIIPRMLYDGKFYKYGILPHLCSKIFRRSAIADCIEHVDENIVAGDDAAIVYPCILKSETICVADVCGYHYVQRQNSVTKRSGQNEKKHIKLLVNYLNDVFAKEGVSAAMAGQMEYYIKYMGLLRQVHIFDETVLAPYGGIPYGKRIVLYGAGVMGQQIHHYLIREGHLDIVGWIDRSWQNYRKKGLGVDPVEKIKDLEEEYDYILIANIMQDTAGSIRRKLVSLGVEESRILWLDEAFLNRKITEPGFF